MPVIAMNAKPEPKPLPTEDDPPTLQDMGQLGNLDWIVVTAAAYRRQRDQLGYKVGVLSTRLTNADEVTPEWREADQQCHEWAKELADIKHKYERMVQAAAYKWTLLSPRAKQYAQFVWRLSPSVPSNEQEANDVLQLMLEMPDGPERLEVPF